MLSAVLFIVPPRFAESASRGLMAGSAGRSVGRSVGGFVNETMRGRKRVLGGGGVGETKEDPWVFRGGTEWKGFEGTSLATRPYDF